MNDYTTSVPIPAGLEPRRVHVELDGSSLDAAGAVALLEQLRAEPGIENAKVDRLYGGAPLAIGYDVADAGTERMHVRIELTGIDEAAPKVEAPEEVLRRVGGDA